jgi:hypothetical protein
MICKCLGAGEDFSDSRRACFLAYTKSKADQPFLLRMQYDTTEETSWKGLTSGSIRNRYLSRPAALSIKARKPFCNLIPLASGETLS